MNRQEQIDSFIESQKSIQFYKIAQQALKDVLLVLPDADFFKITKNLIIMALHEGVLAQAMHFPDPRGRFKIIQLTLSQDITLPVLRRIIAHEFGHIMQGRNWQEEDGDEFEREADAYADKLGFLKTSKIAEYIDKYWKDYSEIDFSEELKND